MTDQFRDCTNGRYVIRVSPPASYCSWLTLMTHLPGMKISQLSMSRMTRRLVIIINGNAPQYLIDHLPGHVRNRTRYNLRNKDDNNLYHCKAETSKSSFKSKSRLKAGLSESTKPFYNAIQLKMRISLLMFLTCSNCLSLITK